jgi:hypothetical protein
LVSLLLVVVLLLMLDVIVSGAPDLEHVMYIS